MFLNRKSLRTNVVEVRSRDVQVYKFKSVHDNYRVNVYKTRNRKHRRVAAKTAGSPQMPKFKFLSHTYKHILDRSYVCTSNYAGDGRYCFDRRLYVRERVILVDFLFS